jgi:hypothetical protein
MTSFPGMHALLYSGGIELGLHQPRHPTALALEHQTPGQRGAAA